MLKTLLLMSVIFGSIQFAKTQESEEKFSPYLSAGLSISNTGNNDFSASSYPSLEFGFMKNNFAAGLVLGRGSLTDFEVDYLSNYFYEIKTALYFTAGNIQPYGLLGLGGYFDTDRFFIEYGAGMSYSFNNFGIFAQASNWDGIWYVTPGVCYCF